MTKARRATAAVARRDGEVTLERDQDIDRIMLSSEDGAAESPSPAQEAEWRGELANRVEAYRVRRRKVSPNATQSKLPFAEPVATAVTPTRTVAVAEASCRADDDFSFTIAIGRIAAHPPAERQMMIDVSVDEDADGSRDEETGKSPAARKGLYPVAPMLDRHLAGAIDLACLLFACGGFLALFGSLGGEFAFSKLNAAVYVAALSVVYLQYFALFTVFGGTTPGMMLRGLQVVSFSGEAPTPRQMLLRSVGYLISAGAGFLGFAWALWDEDGLTWHDRVSKTYLSSAQTYADVQSHSVAHPR